MANWNTLFLDDINIKRIPESSVLYFAKLLEKTFGNQSLKILDLGCGGGRHTVALAKLGHDVYSTDLAENGVKLTREWLKSLNLNYFNLFVADMTETPWKNIKFHGVVCWDTINHNILENIKITVNNIHDSLVKDGLFIGTFKSDKADFYGGGGKEIEHNTFIVEKGKEKGVPHHYFTERELKEIFDTKKWDIMFLSEIVTSHSIIPKDFEWEYAPFPHTTWGVLLRKK